MKFGEYILRVRARLTDMRESDNTFIISPNVDGKRWTADKLSGICKDAISESVRTISAYPNSIVVGQLASNNVVSYTKVTVVNGTLALNDDYLAVLAVNEENVPGPGYGYISPSLLRQYENADLQPRKGEKFFTVIHSITGGSKQLKILPIVGSVKLLITVVYSDTNYSLLNIGKKIPISGLDDLLIDIAEREARVQEGNLDRAAIITQSIGMKLGIGGSK